MLDGEVLAWDAAIDRPLPFAELQRRLNRKRVEAMLFQDVPVIFLAYDLLEAEGEDIRTSPLNTRQQRLEAIIESIQKQSTQLPLKLSPTLQIESWDEVTVQQQRARELGVEGVMLKRLDSPYKAGRVRGDWWKWKVDPYTMDAVLVYAQRGSGRPCLDLQRLHLRRVDPEEQPVQRTRGRRADPRGEGLFRADG